jgi:taurine dioxygenase
MQTNQLKGNNGPRYRHEQNSVKPYVSIEVKKLTPIIGAEIFNVDLSKKLTSIEIDEIHRAFSENQVIFFRNQSIGKQDHVEFGRLFGDLHIHPAAPHIEGIPEMMKIYADENSPRANGEVWHSDVSCDLEPPMGSILQIVQCPPSGGDTLFASMYAAYDALSDRMKTYLNGLAALHDGEPVYRGMYKNFGVQDKDSYPSAQHPVVRTHPVTGKNALYVNKGFTTKILGIPVDESDAILTYLFEHMENPLFQCRFRWEENSIAFWDNRCVQHRAMWDYWPHTRIGHRITVAGDKPFYKSSVQ